MGVTSDGVYQLDGNGAVGYYIHTGSQIGVLLEVKTGSADTPAKPEFKTLLRDLAMQIAAASPQFVGKDSVAPGVLGCRRGAPGPQADEPLARQVGGMEMQGSLALHSRSRRRGVFVLFRKVISQYGENLVQQVGLLDRLH